jgi:transposase
VTIRSVGIDFHQGQHRVRCLDDQAQPCDSFGFHTTPEGLADLEKHIFKDGSNPIVVFEPAGIPWLMVAAYLHSRHPDCRLLKAKMQKVAALRRYLSGPVKSDRIDALTLAKMPFIDPEQMEEVYLPSTKIYILQRLTRQRKRLQSDITGRKVRIEAIFDGYLPGVRETFSSPWSIPVRAFLRTRFNPFAVVRDGEKALFNFLSKAASREKIRQAESHRIFQACQAVADVCKGAEQAATINEELYTELQDEIAREMRLMETEEAESESIERRISEIYNKLHPSNNLCTIPGVGEHTAPIFLATIGDPARFRNQSAFANWTGVVPRSRQSSNMEAKGLRMTKAGPSIMRMALFQSGDIGRRWDPQMAAIYYRQMVFHGKNHKQALGAVMSHLGARVLKVLLEDRPYDLRDINGSSVTRDHARRLILAEYQVSEDIRKARRRRNSKIGKGRETVTNRTNEAAKAPQPVSVQTVSQNNII